MSLSEAYLIMLNDFDFSNTSNRFYYIPKLNTKSKVTNININIIFASARENTKNCWEKCPWCPWCLPKHFFLERVGLFTKKKYWFLRFLLIFTLVVPSPAFLGRFWFSHDDFPLLIFLPHLLLPLSWNILFRILEYFLVFVLLSAHSVGSNSCMNGEL